MHIDTWTPTNYCKNSLRCEGFEKVVKECKGKDARKSILQIGYQDIETKQKQN
jgi:hypothetical protein